VGAATDGRKDLLGQIGTFGNDLIDTIAENGERSESGYRDQ
jgi:hypothetical protein